VQTSNEYVTKISVNEVITPHKNNKEDKCNTVMPKDDSIPIDYGEIVDLDEIKCCGG
jgi:hypothetical protein